jgi:3-oxoacyl-[acyl-carrier protein] reductase
VVPGGIETDLWKNWVSRTAEERGLDFDQQRSKLVSSVPLRDISSPEDVADLALFLASDESRMITGQSIVIDGGGYMLG